MSTGVIVAIIVVVLILLALLVMLPRMRAKAEERKVQKELESRRERVATEHRETAAARGTEADRAEQQARIAQQEAEARRAEAQRHEAEAELHDRGLADDQLVADHERDRFAPVTGGADATESTDAGADNADEQRPGTEYEQGRVDERAAGEERTRRT
jgi:FtsZ-interacting cell division protein ZipA